MTDLQHEIEKTIGDIVHLDRVEKQLQSTQDELDRANKRLDQLSALLREEASEIEKLEGLSTRAIFHKILGNKDKQLEKERQEFLEINLEFEDLEKTVTLLEYEENLLAGKVGTKDTLKASLIKLKQQREDEIIRTDPVLRSRLMQISQGLEDNYSLKNELREASEAGQVCMNMINQIASNLQKVRNWGKWSGRQNRNMNRYRRREAIDRARNLSYQVKHHLHLFDQELKDLGRRLSVQLDTNEFNNFTDFFFDNLITDWILNQKITKALSSIVTLGRKVKKILGQLSEDLIRCDTQITQLKQERDHILTSGK